MRKNVIMVAYEKSDCGPCPTVPTPFCVDVPVKRQQPIGIPDAMLKHCFA